jgi:multiple sugar transport system permease protein
MRLSPMEKRKRMASSGEIRRINNMFDSYKASTVLMRIAIYTFLIALLVITIVPIWLMIVNATRSTEEIQQAISILPSTHLFDNYKILESKGLNIMRGFGNSLFLAVTTTAISVYISLLTAYGIVVYEFKGKQLFSNFVVVLVMIPMQISVVGFYQYMSRLGLTDNYLSLILPSIASAGTVFFAKQYLESIVITDLIDAARIDGASEIGIFHRILFPLSIPGAVTMGIFGFVASWNNFFTPFILISSLDKYTLPMLVKTLQGDVYRTEYGAIYLGLAMTVVPIVVIYAIFSRYIVNGIAMGAVKE